MLIVSLLDVVRMCFWVKDLTLFNLLGGRVTEWLSV